MTTNFKHFLALFFLFVLRLYALDAASALPRSLCHCHRRILLDSFSFRLMNDCTSRSDCVTYIPNSSITSGNRASKRQKQRENKKLRSLQHSIIYVPHIRNLSPPYIILYTRLVYMLYELKSHPIPFTSITLCGFICWLCHGCEIWYGSKKLAATKEKWCEAPNITANQLASFTECHTKLCLSRTPRANSIRFWRVRN